MFYLAWLIRRFGPWFGSKVNSQVNVTHSSLPTCPLSNCLLCLPNPYSSLLLRIEGEVWSVYKEGRERGERDRQRERERERERERTVLCLLFSSIVINRRETLSECQWKKWQAVFLVGRETLKWQLRKYIFLNLYSIALSLPTLSLSLSLSLSLTHTQTHTHTHIYIYIYIGISIIRSS